MALPFLVLITPERYVVLAWNGTKMGTPGNHRYDTRRGGWTVFSIKKKKHIEVGNIPNPALRCLNRYGSSNKHPCLHNSQ